MEYIWYLLASLGAGIGTSLTALGAAMLILHCWPALS